MTSTTASSSSSPSSTFPDEAVVIPDDSLAPPAAFFQLSSSGLHSPSKLLTAGEMALLSSTAQGALPESSTINSSPDSTRSATASAAMTLCTMGPSPSSFPDDSPPLISSGGPNLRFKSMSNPLLSRTRNLRITATALDWRDDGDDGNDLGQADLSLGGTDAYRSGSEVVRTRKQRHRRPIEDSHLTSISSPLTSSPPSRSPSSRRTPLL